MKKKKIVIALGHEALGTTLPEQKEATKRTAKAVADFIREDYQVVITHSNGPQIGMIHTAMNEFCKLYPEYTATPMSVCSAMSQGYIGYDLQNAIRAELLNKGIYKPFLRSLHRLWLTHMTSVLQTKQSHWTCADGRGSRGRGEKRKSRCQNRRRVQTNRCSAKANGYRGDRCNQSIVRC